MPASLPIDFVSQFPRVQLLGPLDIEATLCIAYSHLRAAPTPIER